MILKNAKKHLYQRAKSLKNCAIFDMLKIYLFWYSILMGLDAFFSYIWVQN